MLFTFQSATNSGLMMFANSGKEILALLGQDPEEAQGIVTVEELPAAISALKAALATDKAMLKNHAAKAGEPAPADPLTVSMFQRAVPFIDMLERALKDKEPVIWGV